MRYWTNIGTQYNDFAMGHNFEFANQAYCGCLVCLRGRLLGFDREIF